MTAPPYSKMFPVSWQELHRDAKALAWRLHALRPWRGIVAITRGGLVPAAIVARELDLRVIDTVDSYVTEVSQDTWIMFPWDTELQLAKPIAESGRA